ncbi:MAG: sulfurtransferase TusA family protein [Candidatus Heimdallarchaeaceae archaeon]
MEIAKTLDARGLNCPMPILKTKKAIQEIGIGEILEVLATDPGSVRDFQAWSKATGNEIVESEEKDGIFRYLLKRVN